MMARGNAKTPPQVRRLISDRLEQGWPQRLGGEGYLIRAVHDVTGPITHDHDLEDVGCLSAPLAPERRSAFLGIASRCKRRCLGVNLRPDECGA
jgi:hypothetical protein